MSHSWYRKLQMKMKTILNKEQHEIGNQQRSQEAEICCICLDPIENEYSLVFPCLCPFYHVHNDCIPTKPILCIRCGVTYQKKRSCWDFLRGRNSSCHREQKCIARDSMGRLCQRPAVGRLRGRWRRPEPVSRQSFDRFCAFHREERIALMYAFQLARAAEQTHQRHESMYLGTNTIGRTSRRIATTIEINTGEFGRRASKIVAIFKRIMIGRQYVVEIYERSGLFVTHYYAKFYRLNQV